MRIANLVWIVPIILFLSPVLAAISYNASEDSVFADPLQKPIEVERLVYVSQKGIPTALSYMGIGNTYATKKVIEKEMNITLVYPFNSNVKVYNDGYKYDSDDLYLINNYQVSELVNCSKKADSINDVYKCTVEFNKKLLKQGKVNCRVSTSAFKIAFINSPLAANGSKADFKLMKAFVDGSNYNAHRFIVLSNKNGNFVIDPYWGMADNISTAVKKNSDSFYNNKTALNYRGLVYKVDYFYGS